MRTLTVSPPEHTSRRTGVVLKRRWSGEWEQQLGGLHARGSLGSMPPQGFLNLTPTLGFSSVLILYSPGARVLVSIFLFDF